MKKSIIIFLSAVQFIALIFIIDAAFPFVNLIPDIWVISIFDFLDALFYRSALRVFLVLLIIFTINTFVFIIGYNLCRKHRLGGTLIYIFTVIIYLTLIAASLLFSLFGIIFSKEIPNPFKVVLVFSYLPFFVMFLFIVLEKLVDISFFFLDLINERKEYRKLSYQVEKAGKLTYIKIDTSGSTNNYYFHDILKAAPTLIIEKAVYDVRKAGPISMFLKNASISFLLYLLSRITIWPRTRSFFFRQLTGAKIGESCFIGQWVKFDPLLPDLITLEDDCGVGNNSTVLTHSYIGSGKLTFVFGPVKIGRHVRIGANCVILPGVTIGEGALIAAGSVVAKDVPPYAFAAGSPARVRERTPKD